MLSEFDHFMAWYKRKYPKDTLTSWQQGFARVFLEEGANGAAHKVGTTFVPRQVGSGKTYLANVLSEYYKYIINQTVEDILNGHFEQVPAAEGKEGGKDTQGDEAEGGRDDGANEGSGS